jgi:predicted O-methyltransferase YrrM
MQASSRTEKTMGVVLVKVKRALKSKGLGYVFTRSAERIGDWFRIRRALRNQPRFQNIDSLLDFSFGKEGAFIKPFQVRSEIQSMLKVVQDLKPARVMEIGTANGGTLFLWTRVAAESAQLISLDLPTGKFGDGYPAWKAPLYRSFALPGQKVDLVRDDSHSAHSLEAIKATLKGEKLDYLFIDGDHSYEGAKQDFDMYSPLVRVGGIVGFHDIADHTDKLCQVRRFWLEVKERYPSHEFIESETQGWGGIGYVTV